MYVERQPVVVTTDASGDVTAYSPVVSGRVVQVRYVPDGTNPLATGADVVATGETTGVEILTKANIGTAAFTSVPRQATHLASDGSAALYAAAGQAVLSEVYLANERIKVVVAQGGNTKLGTFHFLIA